MCFCFALFLLNLYTKVLFAEIIQKLSCIEDLSLCVMLLVSTRSKIPIMEYKIYENVPIPKKVFL